MFTLYQLSWYFSDGGELGPDGFSLHMTLEEAQEYSHRLSDKYEFARPDVKVVEVKETLYRQVVSHCENQRKDRPDSLAIGYRDCVTSLRDMRKELGLTW